MIKGAFLEMKPKGGEERELPISAFCGGVTGRGIERMQELLSGAGLRETLRTINLLLLNVCGVSH